MRSGAGWLASATPDEVEDFLGGLSDNALLSLPWIFEFWALPHQLPPDGVWNTWVIMGGRGAGKTRAGAEWVRAQVEGAGPLDPGRAKRVALVADVVAPAQRGTAYGVYNAAIGLAAFPASLIAGLLWQGVGGWAGFGPSAPFLFGAGMALLAVVLLMLWLPGDGRMQRPG